MIALHPWLTVTNYLSLRYRQSFGEVNDPRSNFGVIIDHKNTASHHFMALEVRWLLKFLTDLLETSQKPLPGVFSSTQK